MPRKSFLMACLMIVNCGVAVASCSTLGAAFPRVEDLRVQLKPVSFDEVPTSRIVGEKHDNTVEAWGEAGWLCRSSMCWGRGQDCPTSDAQGGPQ